MVIYRTLFIIIIYCYLYLLCIIIRLLMKLIIIIHYNGCKTNKIFLPKEHENLNCVNCVTPDHETLNLLLRIHLIDHTVKILTM